MPKRKRGPGLDDPQTGLTTDVEEEVGGKKNSRVKIEKGLTSVPGVSKTGQKTTQPTTPTNTLSDDEYDPKTGLRRKYKGRAEQLMAEKAAARKNKMKSRTKKSASLDGTSDGFANAFNSQASASLAKMRKA